MKPSRTDKDLKPLFIITATFFKNSFACTNERVNIEAKCLHSALARMFFDRPDAMSVTVTYKRITHKSQFVSAKKQTFLRSTLCDEAK